MYLKNILEIFIYFQMKNKHTIMKNSDLEILEKNLKYEIHIELIWF